MTDQKITLLGETRWAMVRKPQNDPWREGIAVSRDGSLHIHAIPHAYQKASIQHKGREYLIIHVPGRKSWRGTGQSWEYVPSAVWVFLVQERQESGLSGTSILQFETGSSQTGSSLKKALAFARAYIEQL